MIRRANSVLFIVVMLVETLPQFAGSDSTNFADVIKSSTFIDKSMFIKHVLERKEKGIVVTAPGGFGKSTNINMLRDFLSMEIEGDFADKRRATIDDYRLLKIHKWEFFSKHFHYYPVVFFDFAEIDVRHFADSFLKMLSAIFCKYRYLSNHTGFNDVVKYDINMHCENITSLRPEQVVHAGEKLTWLIFNAHEKRAIVLIDNWDAPVRTAMLDPNVHMPELDRIFKDLSSFVAKLVQNNQFVIRSILTSRLKFGGTFVWEPNCLEYLSIFEDEDISRFFGLNKDEVHALAVKFHQEKTIEDLGKWYGGYHRTYGTALYNTHSVVSFFKLENLTLKRYRIEAPDFTFMEMVFDYEKMGKMLDESLENDIKVTYLLPMMVLYDLKEIKYMLIVKKYYRFEPQLVLQFLYENGFYVLTPERTLRIPNHETYLDLKDLISTKGFFKTKFSIDEFMIENYLDSIDKIKSKNSSYSALATSILKIFKKRLPTSEQDMIQPLYYLTKLSFRFFKVITNEESPNGTRPDLLIHRKDNAGVIIEARYNNATAFDALAEVVSNKYYDLFIKDGLERELMVGVSLNTRREFNISYLYNNHNIMNCENMTVHPIR